MGQVDLRVHPTLIPRDKQIATVDGVLNTVVVRSDGPSASWFWWARVLGALPTASAVCGDVTDIAQHVARGTTDARPVLGLPTQALLSLPRVSRDDVQSEWYLRMVVSDQPGAMADITRLLGNEGISIESLIQRPPKSGAKEVSVVIITDRASGSGIQRAVDAIEQLEALAGSITMLRVEAFEGS